MFVSGACMEGEGMSWLEMKEVWGILPCSKRWEKKGW